MNHIGTQTITTERLTLRRLTMDDLNDKFAWTGSAENSRFIMRAPHESIDEAREALRLEVESYRNDDYYMWGIVYGGELAGYICGNEIDEAAKRVSIGYCLKKEYWNRGIATEAARAVVAYLFGVGFESVFSYHHPQNPASGRVMQKSGLTFERRVKDGSMLAGETCDCLLYKLARTDWEKRAREADRAQSSEGCR